MNRFLHSYGYHFLVILLLTLTIGITIDLLCGNTIKSNGIVVKKTYKEANTYVTFSTSSDGNGNTSTYPVVHHDPPEWHFLVKHSSGEIVTIYTKPDLYYQTNEGDWIPFLTRYGGITGIPYLRSALSY